MRYCSTLWVLGCLICLNSFGHTIRSEHINTHSDSSPNSVFFLSQEGQHPLDSLYKGGSKAYNTLVKKKVRHPVESIKRKTQGTLIFSITVNPKSGPRAKVLTKLDNDIERMVIDFLSQTADNWIRKPEEYTFYQTVFFGVGKEFSSHFAKAELFKNEFTGEWLSPTTSVVTFTVTKTRTTLSGARVEGDSRLPDRSGTPQFSSGYQYNDYRASLNRYKKQLSKKKLEKAYNFLNDVIRYNPFNPSFIKSRVTLAKELGKKEFLVYDELLLKALGFVE